MAHIKSHYRHINGKVVYVRDHDDANPQGRPAELHERTAIGKRQNGGHYLRATDADDFEKIKASAEATGKTGTKRWAGANHHGRVSGYNHMDFDSLEDAKAVHEHMAKQSAPAEKPVEADKPKAEPAATPACGGGDWDAQKKTEFEGKLHKDYKNQTDYLAKANGWKNPHASTAWEETKDGYHKNAQESHEIAAGWHSVEAKKARVEKRNDGHIEGHEGAQKAHDAMAKWHGEQLTKSGSAPTDKPKASPDPKAENHASRAQEASFAAHNHEAEAGGSNNLDSKGHAEGAKLHWAAAKANQKAADHHLGAATVVDGMKIAPVENGPFQRYKGRADQHIRDADWHNRKSIEKAHEELKDNYDKSYMHANALSRKAGSDDTEEAHRHAWEAHTDALKAVHAMAQGPENSLKGAPANAVKHHFDAMEFHKSAAIAHREKKKAPAAKPEAPASSVDPAEHTDAFKSINDAGKWHKGLEMGGGIRNTSENRRSAADAHKKAITHLEAMKATGKDHDAPWGGTIKHDALDGMIQEHKQKADWHAHIADKQEQAKKGSRGLKKSFTEGIDYPKFADWQKQQGA